MGRIYYAPFDDIQVTNDADQDVWELGAITNKLILHGWEMTSELVAAENVDLRLVRRSTSGNPGSLIFHRSDVQLPFDSRTVVFASAVVQSLFSPSSTAGCW